MNLVTFDKEDGGKITLYAEMITGIESFVVNNGIHKAVVLSCEIENPIPIKGTHQEALEHLLAALEPYEDDEE